MSILLQKCYIYLCIITFIFHFYQKERTMTLNLFFQLKFQLKYAAAGLLLALLFTASASFSSLAASLPGALDTVDGSLISGWAWDFSHPEQPVEVTVTVSDGAGNVVSEMITSAGNYRADLAAQGRGSGNYGFSVSMDWSSIPEGVYSVRAFSNGTELPGSRHYVNGHPAGSVRSLGVFKITGYCPCDACSEGWGRHTSTGAVASANHTIAVDPGTIPYGSKVLINGIVYTAEDRGGGVKGNHIDIFYNTHQETRANGTRYQEVFLLA